MGGSSRSVVRDGGWRVRSMLPAQGLNQDIFDTPNIKEDRMSFLPQINAMKWLGNFCYTHICRALPINEIVMPEEVELRHDHDSKLIMI